jgi:acetylornithine aminotransferase
MGNWLHQRLLELHSKHPQRIAEIRVHGLMVGIELTSPGATIWQALLDQGFILNLTQDKVLRLLPPLIITQEELENFIQALDKVLSSVPA